MKCKKCNTELFDCDKCGVKFEYPNLKLNKSNIYRCPKCYTTKVVKE